MVYSVCVSALFGKLPIHEGITRAKEAGYSACEFWGWWDRDLDALLAAQQATGMQPVTFCTRMIPLTETRPQEKLFSSSSSPRSVSAPSQRMRLTSVSV